MSDLGKELRAEIDRLKAKVKDQDAWIAHLGGSQDTYPETHAETKRLKTELEEAHKRLKAQQSTTVCYDCDRLHDELAKANQIIGANNHTSNMSGVERDTLSDENMKLQSELAEALQIARTLKLQFEADQKRISELEESERKLKAVENLFCPGAHPRKGEGA